MGRVRTKTVKKAAKLIVEKYYANLTLDFQTNKKVSEEIAVIPSKRLRNRIAGYVTHLMRRIQHGTVKGVSLKLQEEEKERRMDYVPEVSFVDQAIESKIKIQDDVKSMLNAIGFPELEGIVIETQEAKQPKGGKKFKRREGTDGERKPRSDRPRSDRPREKRPKKPETTAPAAETTQASS